MKTRRTITTLLVPGLLVLAAAPAQSLKLPDGNSYAGKKLVAKTYNSGFPLAHDTYNGMGTASDGNIYYVLSSENIDTGAKMFCFNPKTQTIQQVGDLTEAYSEKGLKTIPQGKSHVNFVEANGKRYGHIIDPRTGWPVSGVSSVTVVSRSAMLCDAWDTGLFVLGSDDARRIAKARDDFAIILVEPARDGRFLIWIEESLRARVSVDTDTAAAHDVRFF